MALLSTVAVGKHETHQGKKRQRVISEGVTTDTPTQKLQFVAGVPQKHRVYMCAQKNYCAQTYTHMHTELGEGGIWIPKKGDAGASRLKKKKSRTFRHATHHGWK